MNVRLGRHTDRTSDNETLIRILRPMDWVLIKFHAVMEEVTVTLRPQLVRSGRGQRSAVNNRRCPQLWIGGSKARFLQNKRGHMLAHITDWHTHTVFFYDIFLQFEWSWVHLCLFLCGCMICISNTLAVVPFILTSGLDIKASILACLISFSYLPLCNGIAAGLAVPVKLKLCYWSLFFQLWDVVLHRHMWNGLHFKKHMPCHSIKITNSLALYI